MIKLQRVRQIVSVILILLSVFALPEMFRISSHYRYFSFIPQPIEHLVWYSILNIMLGLFMLVRFRTEHKFYFMQYFRIGFTAPDKQEPESDKRFRCIYYGIIAILGSLIITYLILRYNHDANWHQLNWKSTWSYLPFIILFALIFSFTEEFVFRLGPIIVLKHTVPSWLTILAFSAVYGLMSYWRLLDGLQGILFFGLFSWLLFYFCFATKSILWAVGINCAIKILFIFIWLTIRFSTPV